MRYRGVSQNDTLLRHWGFMKKLFLSVLLISSVVQANSDAFEKGLKQIESMIDKKKTEENENSEMRAISYLKFKHKDVKLSPGIFLVYNPIKKEFSEKESSLFKNKEAFDYLKNTFVRESVGTGFLYKNYIVTNYHVCRGQDTLIKDYNGEIFSVKVLGYDPNQDICILESDKISPETYPNFAKIKITPIIREEKKQLMHRAVSSKRYEKDPSPKNKEALTKPVYATMFSMWGDFTITNIRQDTTSDEWSKDFSYVAKGNICKGGISGSPVVGTKGLIGIAWGSTTENVKKLHMPEECYFIDKKEIDRVISMVESK